LSDKLCEQSLSLPFSFLLAFRSSIFSEAQTKFLHGLSRDNFNKRKLFSALKSDFWHDSLIIIRQMKEFSTVVFDLTWSGFRCWRGSYHSLLDRVASRRDLLCSYGQILSRNASRSYLALCCKRAEVKEFSASSNTTLHSA